MDWLKWLRLLLCIFAFEVGIKQSNAAEFRGIWVDGFGPGFFNAQQVKKLVEDCRKYNFNAVLVEMRRRGDSFYDSKVDPRTTIITTNFDALAAIIHECHTGTPRIEVHCWVVSHFIWAWEKPPVQPNHVFNLHPEYLTKDSLGQKIIAKGYYLDPGNPAANQTIYDMAKDIVTRYDIDGFHWDYCRYPTQDSGYNELAIRRYNEEFGLTGQPSPKDPRFSEWRRRQVTDFLRWVNADLWQIKPALVISVAVFANLFDAYDYRFSDWARWNQEGIVDFCIPMNFSATEKVFKSRLAVASTNQSVRNIYIGQGAYLNSNEATVAQLGEVRGSGFGGEVFYSYRTPHVAGTNGAATFKYVRDHFQSEWTSTPVLSWKQSKGIVKGTVDLKGREGAAYNSMVSIESPSGAVCYQAAGPRGSFAFFNLDPGEYRVSATMSNRASPQVNLKLEAGAVKTVALILASERRSLEQGLPDH